MVENLSILSQGSFLYLIHMFHILGWLVIKNINHMCTSASYHKAIKYRNGWISDTVALWPYLNSLVSSLYLSLNGPNGHFFWMTVDIISFYGFCVSVLAFKLPKMISVRVKSATSQIKQEGDKEPFIYSNRGRKTQKRSKWHITSNYRCWYG